MEGLWPRSRTEVVRRFHDAGDGSCGNRRACGSGEPAYGTARFCQDSCSKKTRPYPRLAAMQRETVGLGR
jgi:hypothetical protein